MKQSGEISVDPELQNSHFNKQQKFFYRWGKWKWKTASGSESERRGGATVHIQTLLSI